MPDLLDLRMLADELDELRADDEHTDDERLQALEALEGQFLRTLREQGDDYEPTLIHEDYFAEYAKDYAVDVGLITDTPSEWPTRHIDWEAAADELRVDFTDVEFDGENYLIRS